jgi:salicylate hydroxylase
MTETVLIAGGGIGGLASGLGLARAGAVVRVLERAPALTEVGAGVQLGPNVTRILNAWGLSSALESVAAFPANLHARSALSGELLATLSLRDMPARYGAPYITLHRADLQALLLQAAEVQGVVVRCDAHVQGVQNLGDAVAVAQAHQGSELTERADALVVADGVWSVLRQQLLGDGAPRMTGHLAYRALVAQSDLPVHVRTQDVTVWMGPRVHVVQYPVGGGEWLNVVCLTEGQLEGVAVQELQGWNLRKTAAATRADLQAALTGACPTLHALVDACGEWRLWPLCDRVPMRAAHEHVQGRAVLVGDAAHPMRPYLAQGAGMAIEDAAELSHQWTALADRDVPMRLTAFAQARWQRNAQVQARAIRNGGVFHATGPMQWARDAGLRMLGARLMDVPWLYGYRHGA